MSIWRWGSVCLLASLCIPAWALSPPQPESEFLSQTRQFILSGKRSGEGYFSADGRHLIFQSERPGNPFFQMYLLDLESGKTQRVSPGTGKTTCGWIHPNGQHVLFSSTHHDPQSQTLQQAELDFRASGQQKRYSWDYDPQYEIYRADTHGQNLINLSRSFGYDAEGAYSPDGSEIVFASNRQAYQGTLSAADHQRLKHDPAYFMDIYTMKADGSHVRRLTQVPGYDGGPFFSPNGQQIAFRRFNEAGDKAEIWLMNRDGSQQRQVTKLGVMSWAPYFHPSGDYLIFATNVHGFGNFELYIADTAGNQSPVRVTYTEGFDGLPVFSPDGQRLLWTSGRTTDKASQLFMANWNDAAARRLLGLDVREPGQMRLQTQADIRAEDLKQHVTYFASDALQGRLTGSPGEILATEYAADMFKQLGLEPAGDNGSYFQDFRFTAGVELGQHNHLTLGQQTLKMGEEWTPLVFSASADLAPSEVVFAGYGLRAPATGSFGGYDSYVHLDVKDKWVMVLRHWPENVSTEQEQELTRYADLRYKAIQARELGAKGIIIVNGPQSGTAGLIPFKNNIAPGTSSLAALSLHPDVARVLLKQSGHDFDTLVARLDKGESVAGFPLKTVLSGKIQLQTLERRGRNVLARYRVPGSKQAVVLGAHLDHLGTGHHSSSLAKDANGVHYGADDNASGSAAVLEMAEAIARQKPQNLKQDLVFALWSGEELGLLGSSHFVNQYQERLPKYYSAYLNLDMVGRLSGNLVLQGTGSSPLWNDLIEKHNFAIGLPIVLQPSAYLPTDATAFYVKGVPALSAFTGAHRDYHTPGDTADKLNYAGTAQIAALMHRLALDVAQQSDPPAYARQEPPKQEAARGMRVFLGTIPDYTSAVKGMALSGVSSGGPAEKAGLQAGDVVIQLNGKSIENIYDYTFALDGLKVGVAVPIVVLRQGQRLELTITPGARN